jgi:hypothetical protein
MRYKEVYGCVNGPNGDVAGAHAVSLEPQAAAYVHPS